MVRRNYLAAAVLATPVLGGAIHVPQRRLSPAHDSSRASSVKDAFKASWQAYYDNAFPHDTLLPVTNQYYDDRDQWAVTAIDALTTAIVMEEADIVKQILEYVPKIDFTTTAEPNAPISLFETNIRYLGGLIGSYDLLKGPMKRLCDDKQLVDALLKQAQSLADSLSIAFNTPSGVPQDTVYLNPKPRVGNDDANSIAGFGTLVLEWTRLSDLTGNQTYAKLAQKAQSHLIRPKGVPEAFPGLVGHNVGIKDGKFQDNDGGWDGGTDSFYEYLIKMYLYSPDEFEEYKDRWILAADSTMKYLSSHPSTRPDLTFLSEFFSGKVYAQSGHLASFAGGNFILGGILLNEDKYTKFGIDLAESYYETYRQSAAGIGPEVFRWIDSNSSYSVPSDKAEQYKTAGFWATSPGYILRPETMESIYYAYRVTGDRKYQDMAWAAFTALKKNCKVESGAFSGITDVTKSDGGSKDNYMQSFWLAETLKYIYLIFGPESPVQVQADGKNEFVYNTEAHPFRVRS